MTITDANVHDIALGLPLIGVTTWGRNTQCWAIWRAYEYSSTQVLRVSERDDGVFGVPATGGLPLVRFLWTAYCYQQAVGTALEPAMSVVDDASANGVWILQERAAADQSYFHYLTGHQAQYDAVFADNAGLSDLIVGRTRNPIVGTMPDDRLAIIDAGIPPTGYAIEAYDPAWMPAPF